MPAQESFTPEQLRQLAGRDGFRPFDGNPVLVPGDEGEWDAGALGSMTVVKAGGVYHMYYEAWGVRTDAAWSLEEYSTLQIGHATSPDGVHWTKDPAGPVIPRGAEDGAWDLGGTWDPFVIHEDGVFKMWHGGGNAVCDWGYATSRDGSSFRKHGRISDLGKVEDVHVARDEGGRYHMYYWDRAHEPEGLFHATSPDETTFDFAAAEKVAIGGEGYPGMYKFTHVFMEDGKWYMLYGDFVRPHCAGSTVRLATSPDGAEWTRVTGDLLEGHDGEIVRAADRLYLMYHGPRGRFDARDCDIRVALYHGDLDALARRPH